MRGVGWSDSLCGYQGGAVGYVPYNKVVIHRTNQKACCVRQDVCVYVSRTAAKPRDPLAPGVHVRYNAGQERQPAPQAGF
jgi:hypothetical protein